MGQSVLKVKFSKKVGFFPTKVLTDDLASPRSGPICMKDAHSAESNEKYIFPIFIFRVMVDCIYNLLVCHLNFQVYHQPKKIFGSKVAKFTGNMRNALNGFFSSSVFFCATFSFCDMVDFLINHIQNRPYLKI